ncbi:VOC family protein [Streptomyces sp. NPDC093089]|uniref:VOC family protein n=1 Tax=Streptomyces sp. NPDC093089 TaxID=3366024 RepID=UPI00382F3287
MPELCARRRSATRWRLGVEGPVLYFNQVPESKKIKNRIHLCLRPEASREQEVERPLGLGATLVADRRNHDGTGWAVLADPEGNEFCVLRSESDRAAMDS